LTRNYAISALMERTDDMRSVAVIGALALFAQGCAVSENSARANDRAPASVYLLEDCGTNNMGCYTVSKHASSGECRAALQANPAPAGRVRGCRPGI